VIISLFLPHVGVFGGVRRFLELGNAWTAMGHGVTLFHPEGTPPTWLPFSGTVRRLESAGGLAADVAVCADAGTLEAFLSHRALRHLYYCVIEGDPAVPRAASHAHVRLAANSGALRQALERSTRRHVLDGIGGINLRQFRPDPARRAEAPLRVLLNGRRSRSKKGTDLLLAALAWLQGRVPPFEIVLFDTVGPENRQDPRDGARMPKNARFFLGPTQEELTRLYQSAHVFAAAERKAGWCNTALEAMACGAAVVCTKSGTGDFARNGENALVVAVRHPWFLRPALRRVLADAALREALGARAAAEAERWSWEDLAVRLLEQVVKG
jgi:glycosyltransferase involved in cell wall biosynthesis